jgi:hypothetical protein
MAADRAGAIAAAVEEEENAGGIAACNDRPFPSYAVDIDRLELDVVGDRPDRADFVDALAAFGPADGPRLGGSSARTASISL